MKKSPVTFLIPAFNVELHLKSCLEGIYNQTFTNFKVLIINDGSTDGTEEILRQINDSRFCVIHRRKNMGYIYCLNLGLALIKTKYTARLDADDIPMPRRLENQIKFNEWQIERYRRTHQYKMMVEKDFDNRQLKNRL